jgi:mRNA interferase MazF
MNNYDFWSSLKQNLDQNNNKIPFFNNREIWWSSLGLNIGDEEFGKGNNFVRPILVFKKFNNNLFFGIPMTTKQKESHFYYNFVFKAIPVSAMLSQLRIFSSKRLRDKIGRVNQDEFENTKKSLIGILE